MMKNKKTFSVRYFTDHQTQVGSQEMSDNEEICSKDVKMAGYLEKKGKMKISPWKRYWFVLEGRLLLYFKSQKEYINLSPCKGSLNMGLASTVHPGTSKGPFHIHVLTRTQIFQLRAKDRRVQEEWLQALLDSMALPFISNPVKTLPGMTNLRYSMDEIPTVGQNRLDDEVMRKQRTLPHRPKNWRVQQEDIFNIRQRMRRISGQSYGGSLDTVTAVALKSAGSGTRTPSPNIPKGKMAERILGYVEEDDDDDSFPSSLGKSMENIVSSVKNDLLSSNKSALNHSCDNINKQVKTFPRSGVRNIQDENQNQQFLKLDEVEDSRTVSEEERTKETEDDYKIPILPPRPDRSLREDISRFDKIKKVIKMKKSNEKQIKNEIEVLPVAKKRRNSFLRKVFQKTYKKEKDSCEKILDDDSDDPLYDTIKNMNDVQQEAVDTAECQHDEVEHRGEYATPFKEKKVFGSINIMPEFAMTELKTILNSRESVNREDAVETVKVAATVDILPLPPKLHTRPKSPYHDVPTNNQLVTSALPSITINGEDEDESKNLFPTVIIQNDKQYYTSTESGLEEQVIEKNFDAEQEHEEDLYVKQSTKYDLDVELEPKHDLNVGPEPKHDLDVEPEPKYNLDVELKPKHDLDVEQEPKLNLDVEQELRHNLDVEQDLPITLRCTHKSEETAVLSVKSHDTDLLSLLEQLSHITTAPLLNQTSSLTDAPNLYSGLRKRRLSDPDYDIPRPHRLLSEVEDVTIPLGFTSSLQSEPKSTEDKIFEPNDSDSDSSTSDEEPHAAHTNQDKDTEVFHVNTEHCKPVNQLSNENISDSVDQPKHTSETIEDEGEFHSATEFSGKVSPTNVLFDKLTIDCESRVRIVDFISKSPISSNASMEPDSLEGS